MTHKILFIISALKGGGAERIMLTLINNINRGQFKPLLVLFDDNISAYKEDIPDYLPIRVLKKDNRLDNFRLIKSLSQLIQHEKPCVAYSLLNYTNVITILSNQKAGANIPVILSQHTFIEKELQESRQSFLKKIFDKNIIRYTYSKATLIHCVSKGLKINLVKDFNIPPEKIRVIYNSLDLKRIISLAKEEVEHPWFQEDVPILLACGRLQVEKNYPLLFRSLRHVQKTIPVRLVILGEGQEREGLENYAKDLGIVNNVDFLGFQKNPFKFMARGMALVLSSSWEAFGMVIIEAMACGLPVISTRCPFGPEEIINHGVNGLLVPVEDEHKLAEAILALLKEEELRKKLAEGGQRRAQDFDVVKLIPQFEEMLLNLCQSPVQ
ncbi:MAG: glycosyltransferase [Deltaproteobacteria bacterium]|nr:glycosyltransferase [Desulfitobacteriaceae bacterium]MDI6854779.1 glycosyltransferase [Deltaproteobacteria bacterium]